MATISVMLRRRRHAQRARHDGRIEGREVIKTTLGTFKTIRVQPTADAGVVKNRGNIWIWYTDDDRHLPVQMRAKLFWGTITFRLIGNDNK